MHAVGVVPRVVGCGGGSKAANDIWLLMQRHTGACICMLGVGRARGGVGPEEGQGCQSLAVPSNGTRETERRMTRVSNSADWLGQSQKPEDIAEAHR